MSTSLSKSNAIIVPVLLEQQISPPRRVVAKHLKYLQRWREYLFCVFADASKGNARRTSIQRETDELIALVMLIDFVKRSDDTAIPAIEEALTTVSKPAPFNVGASVHNQVCCKGPKCLTAGYLFGRGNKGFLRFFAAPMGAALLGSIDLLMGPGYGNIHS